MRAKAFAVAAVLPVLAACADLGEHVITGVTGAYYGTPEGANAALTASYFTQNLWLAYLNEASLFFPGTDSWEKGQQAKQNGLAPFNDYASDLNAQNTVLRNEWAGLYLAVNTANTAIRYIAASTEIPDSGRSRMLGEARFLRALHYFVLVRMWGAVSLSLEPTEGVVTTATRTPIDSIYSRAIIPDLEFAVAKLPDSQEKGRATRGAARTLLAEVYLTRAQPGDFDRARDLTTAVIASGTYKLNASYLGLFCGPAYPEACEFKAENEKNPEFIYAVQHSSDRVHDIYGNAMHLPFVMGYTLAGAANPPGLLRSLQYGRAYFSLMPTRHLLNLWNRATDSRYDATFQTLWKYLNGDTAIYFPGSETVPTQYQGRPYKAYGQSQYTWQLYPTLRKWLDDKRTDINQIWSARDRHLWRLADVYLLRAEAYIRAKRVQEAIPDFNELRRRAALPGKNNELSEAEIAQLNADPIDFLLDERERELAGEEQRWFVLTRLGKLVERVRAYNAAGAPNVQDFHELRPIPQEQIDRTRGGTAAFPQNPGY